MVMIYQIPKALTLAYRKELQKALELTNVEDEQVRVQERIGFLEQRIAFLEQHIASRHDRHKRC